MSVSGYSLIGKYGLKVAVRGAHVLTIAGRLAQIERVQRDETRGQYIATLRHLNGELMPEQAFGPLTLLVRTYENEE